MNVGPLELRREVQHSFRGFDPVEVDFPDRRLRRMPCGRPTVCARNWRTWKVSSRDTSSGKSLPGVP